MKYVLHFHAMLVFMFFSCAVLAADQVAVIPLWTTKDLKNVITVSQKGGDFTDPIAAINSIGDAGVNNPYLLVIGPGVYTLTETLVMKEHVVITGAGEKATVLSGAISSGSTNVSASLVAGASNASLRWLTVKNTGGGAYSYGIFNSATSPVIQNVTVDVSGGTYWNVGIYSSNSTPFMDNVTVNAVNGSDNYAVWNNSANSTMQNVSVSSVNGSNFNLGIFNQGSSDPVMQNIIAKSTGGTHSRAVYDVSSSSSTMTNLVAIATGGSSSSYGVYITTSSRIQRSTMSGDMYGLYSSTGTTNISQSTIIGGVGGSGAKKCVASDNGTGSVLLSGCN